jgi:hypothetical protein
MKIGNHPHGGEWPHCMASIDPVKVGEDEWEYRFPVPIPEKLWEVRARWPIGSSYWKDLVQPRGSCKAITPVVVDGYVEKVVLEGRPPYQRTLEFDINSPGEPFEPYEQPSPNREERILDHITSRDYEVEPGVCHYCEEEIPEDAEECPECGIGQSHEAPTVGELVEKYGPDARVFVYFHDRDVSLNVAYTLDDEGLAREKAERQAKYEAEVAEYEVLKAEWDELVEKVSAYNEAKTEADERAKLEELKAKYGETR